MAPLPERSRARTHASGTTPAVGVPFFFLFLLAHVLFQTPSLLRHKERKRWQGQMKATDRGKGRRMELPCICRHRVYRVMCARRCRDAVRRVSPTDPFLRRVSIRGLLWKRVTWPEGTIGMSPLVIRQDHKPKRQIATLSGSQWPPRDLAINTTPATDQTYRPTHRRTKDPTANRQQ